MQPAETPSNSSLPASRSIASWVIPWAVVALGAAVRLGGEVHRTPPIGPTSAMRIAIEALPGLIERTYHFKPDPGHPWAGAAAYWVRPSHTLHYMWEPLGEPARGNPQGGEDVCQLEPPTKVVVDPWTKQTFEETERVRR